MRVSSSWTETGRGCGLDADQAEKVAFVFWKDDGTTHGCYFLPHAIPAPGAVGEEDVELW